MISLAERPCPFISFLKKRSAAFYPYAFEPEHQEHRHLDPRLAIGIVAHLEQSQCKPHPYTMYHQVFLDAF